MWRGSGAGTTPGRPAASRLTPVERRSLPGPVKRIINGLIEGLIGRYHAVREKTCLGVWGGAEEQSLSFRAGGSSGFPGERRRMWFNIVGKAPWPPSFANRRPLSPISSSAAVRVVVALLVALLRLSPYCQF